MFAGYYAKPRDVDEVVSIVGLEEKRDARVKTLSGGQRRRLDLGVALVGDPDLVFLDEPTTGFDPAARRSAWELIRSLRSLGKTILLTTHYLDEAQQLADRVAVISAGSIVSLGTPAELIGETRKAEIRFRRDGETWCSRRTSRRGLLHELTSEALASGRRAGAARGAPARRSRTSTSTSSAKRRAPGNDDALAISSRTSSATFWRSREAAVFIFIFPLLLYSLLGSVYSDEIELDGERYSSADVLLAGLFGYSAANTAFAGLAIILVGRREAGFLKRLRSTPLPPATYITAVLTSMLVVFALQSVALLALGALAFDASVPENMLGFVGSILLGAACFSGLGVGAASLIRSDEGVSAVVNVIVLPMAFLSGSFGPTADYPAFLEAVGSCPAVEVLHRHRERRFPRRRIAPVGSDRSRDRRRLGGRRASPSPCATSAGCLANVRARDEKRPGRIPAASAPESRVSGCSAARGSRAARRSPPGRPRRTSRPRRRGRT